jgi:hypothetical protein
MPNISLLSYQLIASGQLTTGGRLATQSFWTAKHPEYVAAMFMMSPWMAHHPATMQK